ncbi:MAG: ABC transporter ATP-binding protein [Alishewanella aestuarii]
MAFIDVQSLSKVYQQGRSQVTALDNINLQISKGEFVAIMGPSGSGKSTLSHLLGGMDTPTAGSVLVDGRDIYAKPAKLGEWRGRHVGFMFQQAFLLPGLNAIDNVQLPLLRHPMSAAERKRRAHIALELVGLADLAAHKPAEMSGGQEQRCALARAIITDPALLICDEPTGALDRENADMVTQMLQLLSQQQKKTVIIVSHDPKVAIFADRTIRLEKGGRLSSETRLSLAAQRTDRAPY